MSDDLEAMREITETCRRAGAGDLEARVALLDGSDAVLEIRDALNDLLDRTDAFVREAGASSAAAASGEFHRQFLTQGMGGAFRRAATQISESTAAMSHNSAQIAEAAVARLALADQLETAVLALSERLATAAGEMGNSAKGLADFARDAVSDADDGLRTVTELRRSAGQIRHAVDLIKRVAMQTQLLSLNATIEASHAGPAGRGFGVVANEVKVLANETGESSEQIMEEVDALQQASNAAVGVLKAVADRIREMSGLIDGIAAAVDGQQSTDQSGLTQLADVLKREVQRFLTTARAA